MCFLSALLTLGTRWESPGNTTTYNCLKTWTEAQSYCRENFVDLATIETEEDWERVNKIMENADSLAWRGLYDDIKSWRWSIDNTYLYSEGDTEFGEWFVFANQVEEHCIEIVGSKLYDRSCTILQNSVCYDSEYELRSQNLSEF